jgi:hypothetical protein
VSENGVSKAGDRMQDSQSQQSQRQQQRAHHCASQHRHPPASQPWRVAVQHPPQELHVLGHYHPGLPPLPSAPSSFLRSSSSSNLPFHQPAYRQQQLPPISSSSSRVSVLSAMQLNRLQYLQAERDDDSARHDFTTDSVCWNSRLPAVVWASRSSEDVNSSSSIYCDGQLSQVSQQRWQQQRWQQQRWQQQKLYNTARRQPLL